MFRLYMVYHKSFLIQQITRLIKQDFTQIRVINLLIKQVMYFKQTTLQGNEQLYGRGLSSFFPFPSYPARSLFLSPQSPYNTKRPLWRKQSLFQKAFLFNTRFKHFTMRLAANNLVNKYILKPIKTSWLNISLFSKMNNPLYSLRKSQVR